LSIRQSEGPSAPLRWLAKAAISVTLAALLAAASAGCGGAEGVAKGASVTAYVVAPLCGDAERALERAGGRAGDLRLEAVCLSGVESNGRVKLATVGSDARRATEDSTAIAFLEAPGRGNESSEPILESAEIPSIHSPSGAAAMTRLLKAIDRAGSSGSLRSELSDQLNR